MVPASPVQITKLSTAASSNVRSHSAQLLTRLQKMENANHVNCMKLQPKTSKLAQGRCAASDQGSLNRELVNNVDLIWLLTGIGKNANCHHAEATRESHHLENVNDVPNSKLLV